MISSRASHDRDAGVGELAAPYDTRGQAVSKLLKDQAEVDHCWQAPTDGGLMRSRQERLRHPV